MTPVNGIKLLARGIRGLIGTTDSLQDVVEYESIGQKTVSDE